jgi:hypothetical protein
MIQTLLTIYQEKDGNVLVLNQKENNLNANRQTKKTFN